MFRMRCMFIYFIGYGWTQISAITLLLYKFWNKRVGKRDPNKMNVIRLAIHSQRNYFEGGTTHRFKNAKVTRTSRQSRTLIELEVCNKKIAALEARFFSKPDELEARFFSKTDEIDMKPDQMKAILDK